MVCESASREDLEKVVSGLNCDSPLTGEIEQEAEQEATIVGQLVDSAIFYPVAFGGIWTTRTLLTIVLFNWSLKVLVEISAGIEYLRGRDPVLKEVITRVGPFDLKREPDVFTALVSAIISQQISTGAARSIYRRLCEASGGETMLLSGLLRLDGEGLRAVGVSAQKARYLRDLAEKVSSGEVCVKNVSALSNEAIISELTKVKGIGVWTVQMLLIFSLGRLDVFPGADLGIRTAIQRLYRKRKLPAKPAQLRKFEKLWQPYASIASWYCWRSLEFDEYKKARSR